MERCGFPGRKQITRYNLEEPDPVRGWTQGEYNLFPWRGFVLELLITDFLNDPRTRRRRWFTTFFPRRGGGCTSDYSYSTLTASRNPEVYRLRSNLMMRRLVCTEKLAASHRKCRCRQQMISYSRYLKFLDSNTIGEVMFYHLPGTSGASAAGFVLFLPERGGGLTKRWGAWRMLFHWSQEPNHGVDRFYGHDCRWPQRAFPLYFTVVVTRRELQDSWNVFMKAKPK